MPRRHHRMHHVRLLYSDFGNILMQLGKSTMEPTCTNLFYTHGALTDEGVSGGAMCSGGGGAAWRNSGSGWIPKVFHASFVGGFYNRVIPFLWSRLLGDIPRRENPFVNALRKLDEIINSQVTTFRYIQDPSVISRLAKH